MKSLIATLLLVAMTTREAAAQSEPPLEAASNALASTISGPAGTITPDQFLGVAQVVFPIALPAGPAGVTPSVSLVYRSSNNRWELDFGAIERETANGIAWNGNKYVLRNAAGKEQLTAMPDGTYATVIASRFDRIERRTDARGLLWWALTDKRGNVSEYGPTDASRLSNPANQSQIFSWRLARITDPDGNSIVVSYAKDGAQIYPDTLRYAESPGLPANTVVRFVHEGRPDVEFSWQLGFEVVTTRRLRRITVESGGHDLPSYELDYGTPSETTRRSLLRSIAIQSPQGRRLPATEYSYQEGPLDLRAPFWNGGAVPGVPVGNQCLFADWDGNSLTDVACYTTQPAGLWHMMLATGNGWRSFLIHGPAPGVPVGNQCIAGDTNGDGRDDLLCYATGGKWHRMLGSDDGWGATAMLDGAAPGIPIGRQCLQGDYNGDARLDLACATTVADQWHLTLSTGDGFIGSFIKGPKVANAGSQCVAINLDADRRTDLACWPGAGNIWEFATSNANGWTLWKGKGPVAGLPISARCAFGDYNADGRVEPLCFTGVDNLWHLSLSAPDGFTAVSVVPLLRPGVPIGQQCLAAELNGDARTDLLCQISNGAWRVFASTGRAFEDRGTVSGPAPGFPIGARCGGGDFNGDAKSDLACFGGGGAFHMLLSDEVTPDLLRRVKTPLGGITTFAYGRALAMRNSRMPIPIDVLLRTTLDDGLGLKSTTSYAYEGGHYEVRTRDFRGFAKVLATEPSSGGIGATTETLFLQGNAVTAAENDPAADGAYMRGRPWRARVFDERGALLDETTWTYQQSSAVPRFNPIAGIVRRICDGEAVCVQSRVELEYDGYGNVTKEINHGDLTRPGDELTRIVTYGYNRTRYIVSSPVTEEVLQGTPGTERLAYTELFYDGANTCNQADGSVIPQRGRVTRTRRWIRDGVAAETRTAFDAQGNVVCTANARGYKALFEYDPSRRFLLATVNALGHRTRFTYYGVDGQGVVGGLYGLLRGTQDANGAIAWKAYDEFGREMRTVDAAGASTWFHYADIGNPRRQHIRAESALGLSTSTFLDGLGRETAAHRSGAAGTVIVTTTRYDERGLVVATSLPYFLGSQPIGEILTTYDASRRVMRRRDPAGAERTHCYAAGVTDIIDENGHRTRQIRTATGELRRVEEYKGTYRQSCPARRTDGVADVQPFAVTLYRADALGRLISMTDPKGAVTTVDWDALSQRVRITDPYAGAQILVRDENGNVVQLTNAAGESTFYVYDAIDRIRQKSFMTAKPLGQGDLLYGYDEPRSFGIGRRTSSRSSAATQSIHYTATGLVSRVERVIDGRTWVTSQEHDPMGRVTATVYPDGARIVTSYDGPYPSAVSGNGVVYARLSSYNPAGSVGLITFGNGIRTSLTYETPSNPICPRATYRVCGSITMASAGAMLSKFQVEYDPGGNVTVIRERDKTRSLIYDDADELIAVATSTTGATASAALRSEMLTADFTTQWTDAFRQRGALVLEEASQYDSSRNLTWKSDIGAYVYPPAGAAARPHAPHTAGGQPLRWDSKGNLIFGLERTYAYQLDGHVAAVSDRGGVTQYFYDADGDLVREGSAAGVKLRIGGNYECMNGRCAKHVSAGGLPIATIADNGEAAYYHLDHQGSTRLVTDARGLTGPTFRYGAFGVAVRSGTIPSFVPTAYLFTGLAHAAKHDIYIVHGRPYDPRFGRFLTPDPRLASPGLMRYLNRYSYGLNNPTSFVDPDGEWAIPIIVGAVLGAIIGGVSAHLQDGDWTKGALLGAISGAFTGGAYSLTSGVTDQLMKALIYGATGAASGGVTAGLGGGDIVQGIGYGAAFGFASQYGENFLNVWDKFGLGKEVSGIANQLTDATARGAAFGGLHAASTGQSIWVGMRQGAIGYALGEAANMGVGHTIGFIGSGGQKPQFIGGRFVYDLIPEWSTAVTFSNVIGARDVDYLSNVGWSSSTSGYTIFAHEFWHTFQSLFLGPAYIPAHALSLTGSFLMTGDTHRANGLERVFHYVPH